MINGPDAASHTPHVGLCKGKAAVTSSIHSLNRKQCNIGLNMLPWTSFTCYTKDNQQGCFRLSNWFSLRRLGPWMNHLPPAWQSTYRLTFQNESWYVSLEWYFIYLLFLASVHGFMYETSDFLLCNNLFIYQVLCTLIYRRRSLYSFLLDGSRHICTSLLSYTHLYVLITTYSWDETFKNDDNLKKMWQRVLLWERQSRNCNSFWNREV